MMKSVSFGDVAVGRIPQQVQAEDTGCMMYTGKLIPHMLNQWKDDAARKTGLKWEVALGEQKADQIAEHHLVMQKEDKIADGTVRVVNLLHPDECRAIIDNAERIGYMSTDEQRNPYLTVLRPANESGLMYLESKAFADSLWARIAHFFTEPLALQCREFAPSYAFLCSCSPAPFRPYGVHPRMKLLRYKSDQFFKPHTDTTVRVQKIGARRGSFRNAFTLAIYLNTEGSDYTGGGLRFHRPPRVEVVQGSAQTHYDDHPAPTHLTFSAGQAAIFPPGQWHTAEPVTDGTKYMIQADIMYAQL